MITRFAPSPTGALHLGHIYAAKVAHDLAQMNNGRFHLRIDDLDRTRCRPDFIDAIYDDLRWVGLDWHGTPSFQSDRQTYYAKAITRLHNMDLLYPCYLTRRELAEMTQAPHGTPYNDSPIMPINTDQMISDSEQKRRAAEGQQAAWRLRMDAAIKATDSHTPFSWRECAYSAGAGLKIATPEIFGDVVIARKDLGSSYHLAVVIDDMLDNVSLVTRGVDLQASTHLHRLLQALLDLPTPDYLHHPLVTDADNKRLAKRDKAQAVDAFRHNGMDAESLMAYLPPLPGYESVRT
ncbi:tRNA glutamyl-Q(34) synthetase GluQRS [Candidatus Puniceispirillum sp.]|jgi:glutamyl-Q tRNA(Asp) synthetase|uniref:tRNA glutamyl-Q(34) synthetase GluQRS n=1 Tax=Candidatus Puniceispirillum sp. TaxID=2026719 RepID=UPI001EC6922D|nr:tRNA glutamyl-Q(34) synthetase GluQRS [Candidatus Puniceispirillum sp.]MBT6566104.1 tRNA glutamyl-Q(34) synthetase GluQRS [Candidatus Puniceispirillum sp.]